MKKTQGHHSHIGRRDKDIIHTEGERHRNRSHTKREEAFKQKKKRQCHSSQRRRREIRGEDWSLFYTTKLHTPPGENRGKSGGTNLMLWYMKEMEGGGGGELGFSTPVSILSFQDIIVKC